MGLIAAFAVFASSLAILIAGSTGQIMLPAMELGQCVPAITLPDQNGNEIRLQDLQDRFLIMVFANPNTLSDARRKVIADIANTLGRDQPVRFITIADTNASTSAAVCPHTQHVLVDSQRIVHNLLGIGDDTAICLIDPNGILQYRVILSPNTAAETEVRNVNILRELLTQSPLAAAR